MATLDDSPSLFSGQPWTIWVERIEQNGLDESKSEEHTEKPRNDSDAMKLRKEDMGLFGLCPAQDEFYLVVCERCGQVIKPQALKHHIEQRHGSLPPTNLCVSNVSSKLCKSSATTNAANKTATHGGDSPSPRIHSVSTTKHNSSHPKLSGGQTSSGHGKHSTAISQGSSKTAMPPLQKPVNPKRTNSMPVVKVERMPSPVVMKKKVNQNEPEEQKILLGNGGTGPGPGPGSKVKSSPSPSSVATPVKPTSSSKAPSVTSPKTNPSPIPTKKPAVEFRREKLLPCKDREFDPNKHCGAWIADIAKQCTRSLTCKTHALSLRRAVSGRRKPFDELLKEHRAAKEALLKAKAAAAAGNSAPPAAAASAAVSSTGQSSGEALAGKEAVSGSEPLVPASSVPHSKTSKGRNLSSSAVQSQSVFAWILAPCVVDCPGPGSMQSPADKRSGSTSGPSASKEESVPPPETSSRLSSDGEFDGDDADKPDYSYIPFHPRPAAMNPFGSRLYSGGGCYAFSRKMDLLRAAFRAAVERHLHPPPHKKLCVESRLPHDWHASSDSKDPYEFVSVEPNASTSAAAPSLPGAAWQTAKVPSSKHKTCKSVSRTIKPKEVASARSPVGAGLGRQTNAQHPTNLKRKRSCSLSPAQPSGVNNVTTVASSNLTVNHPTASPISIAIPGSISLNLPVSTSTLSNINASLTTNKVANKNNLLKDLSIVVTNLDPSMVNGQFVSIPGTSLAEVTHLQLNSLTTEKSSAKSRKCSSSSRQSASGKSHNVQNSSVVQDGSMNSVMTALSGNAVLLDTLQTQSSPANLAHNSFTAVSVPTTPLTPASNAMSPPLHPSPSTTPSPLLRPGSASPQMHSPLPNGLMTSPSGMTLKGFPLGVNHVTANVTVSPASAGTPSPSFASPADSSTSNGTHFSKLTGKTQGSLSGRHNAHGQKNASGQRPAMTMQQNMVGSQRGSTLALPQGMVATGTVGLQPGLVGQSTGTGTQAVGSTLSLATPPLAQLVTSANMHTVYTKQLLAANSQSGLSHIHIQPKQRSSTKCSSGNGTCGKVATMQPMSLTIPIVAQHGVPITMQQQQTHAALLIQNEERRKQVQELTQQMQSSPTGLIS